MMFIFHVAITLGLVAFSLGIALLIWGMRNEGAGIQLAKVFGILVAIFAVISMLCSVYYNIKYWKKGFFETPTTIGSVQGQETMQGSGMMQGPGMMQGQGMMQGRRSMMMQNQQGNDQKQGTSQKPSKSQNHSSHH